MWPRMTRLRRLTFVVGALIFVGCLVVRLSLNDAAFSEATAQVRIEKWVQKIRWQDEHQVLAKSWTVSRNWSATTRRRTATDMGTTEYFFKPFLLPLPSFTTPADRKWFLQYSYVRDRRFVNEMCLKETFYDSQPTGVLRHTQLQFCRDPTVRHRIQTDTGLAFVERHYIYGQLNEQSLGRIPMNLDCGWQTNMSANWQRGDFTSAPEASSIRTVMISGRLWYLNVPEGALFQHFIDGILPKIVLPRQQAIYRNAQVYFQPNAYHPLVMRLLEYMQVPTAELMKSMLMMQGDSQSFDHFALDPQKTMLLSERLIENCVWPPIHPQLWQASQHLLASAEPPVELRSAIVYAGRSHASDTYNVGRRVMNEHVLLKWIRFVAERFRLAVNVFDSKQLLDENYVEAYRAYWARAKILIGPHGGALYNQIFMRSATVIELFPVKKGTGKSVLRHSGMMNYLQAAMLGHNYWLIRTEALNDDGDMNADPAEVAAVIHHVLSSQINNRN